MTEQAKVPAIRFAGFTDPWEQRKASEVSKSLMIEAIRHCLFCQRRRIKA